MSVLLAIKLLMLWFYAISVIPAFFGYLVCAYGAFAYCYYIKHGRDYVLPVFRDIAAAKSVSQAYHNPDADLVRRDSGRRPPTCGCNGCQGM